VKQAHQLRTVIVEMQSQKHLSSMMVDPESMDPPERTKSQY
jgi:hypothetical protein